MKSFRDFGIELPGTAAGQEYATCPKCSSQRKKKSAKCLSVNLDEGIWNCHHCGWSGTLREGEQRKNDDHWRKPAYVRPSPLPAPEDHELALIKWFSARAIGGDVLRRNQVHLREVYMPQVEDRVKAICFPYYRGTELINAKYRDKEKNFRMEPGAERVLYGLNDLAERMVIVEGELDKLSVEVAGITACVSVPDGAPDAKSKNYASKFTFLDSDADRLEQIREWTIAVDNDEPGLRLEQELVRRFGPESCKRVSWPGGCKDANDVLVKHGAAAPRECIERAHPYPLQGVIEVSMVSREIAQLYEEGEKRGLSTGWKNLDEHYTVRPGEITVITGIPNSGKSNWRDSLLVNIA